MNCFNFVRLEIILLICRLTLTLNFYCSGLLVGCRWIRSDMHTSALHVSWGSQLPEFHDSHPIRRWESCVGSGWVRSCCSGSNFLRQKKSGYTLPGSISHTSFLKFFLKINLKNKNSSNSSFTQFSHVYLGRRSVNVCMTIGRPAARRPQLTRSLDVDIVAHFISIILLYSLFSVSSPLYTHTWTSRY